MGSCAYFINVVSECLKIRGLIKLAPEVVFPSKGGWHPVNKSVYILMKTLQNDNTKLYYNIIEPCCFLDMKIKCILN